MYQPSKYAEHNASLNRWILKFNAAKPSDIIAKAYETEKFVHDGILDLWGVIVRYDWEKRQDWQGQQFPFLEVGQFDRKFSEDKEIDLAIMCNTTETHFLGAWHSDFSGRIAVKRKTEFISKEDGVMRTCSKYKVMGYQELELFKKWLLNTYPLTLGKVQLKR